MLGMNWLIRMSRWTRRPPALSQVLLVLAVIVLCLVLAGVQHLFGWPDWLAVNGKPKLKLK